MSATRFLEQALKLLRHKGTEKELIDIAKNLSPTELEALKSAYRAQFKPGFYHGTPASEPFESFNLGLGKAGADDGPIGAAFVTKNPEFAKNFTGIDRKGKVLPMRVNTSNIFDYQNPEHIAKLVEEVKRNPLLTKVGQEISEEPFVSVNGKKLNPYLYYIRRGDWEMLEHPETIKAIKNLGFDGMHVAESGEKNIALFNPNVDARYENAKFDPLKKDTGNLLSSLALATGAGTAAASMMPEEAEAGITYKAGEVAKALDSLRKSGKLVPTEVLKALNYSAPSTKNEIATARAAMKNVLEHGLRERAGLMASSPNWRVNEEIVKTFHPELRDIFPVSEGSRAEQIMKERGIKDAAGAFYSDATDSPIIPYRGKGIAVIDDSPSLVHHEDTHAIESLLYPNMAETSLAQYFSGKRSKDLFKQSNEELAKKLSIVSKTGETEEEILKFLNSIRPEGHGESKELRKIINAQSDAFQLGDAGHFINYPKNFELTRGLEMLKDEVKVPKGSLKENRALMDEIINNPKLSKSEVNKRLAKIQENAELVPSVKKHRYVLPDKMPFAVAGAVGAGMLASPEKATATEMQDSNSPLNVGENSKIEPSPAPTPSPDYEPRKAYNRGKSFNKGYLEGSENANRILFDKNLSFDEKQQKLEEMNALGDSSIMNEYIKEKDPEQYGRLKGIEDKIDLIDPSNYFLGGWKRVIPRKFASEILPAVKKELPKVKGLLPNKTDVLSVLKGEANKEVENDVLKMLKGEN